MSRSENKGSRQNDRPPPQDPLLRVEGRGALFVAGAEGRDGGPSKRARGFGAERPVLRFVVIYSALMLAFTAFFYGWFSKSRYFDSYLGVNAHVSAAILGAFGQDAEVSETLIHMPGCALDIKRGCDAILASGLFLLGIVAFPARVGEKLPAMVIGTVALAVLNLVRIVSLLYVKKYFPGAFHVMHLDVWQIVFVLVPLVFWLSWAWWAKGRAMARDVSH